MQLQASFANMTKTFRLRRFRSSDLISDNPWHLSAMSLLNQIVAKIQIASVSWRVHRKAVTTEFGSFSKTAPTKNENQTSENENKFFSLQPLFSYSK